MMELSQKDQQTAIAAAIFILVAAVLFIFFFVPTDAPADGGEFYSRLVNSGEVGILYDVRAAGSDAQVSAVYQCGVDIISKGRFAGKTIDVIACDGEGCLSVSTATNGSNRMSFDQAQRKFASVPYILIKAGEPGYSFYQRHMEIVIGSTAAGGVSCDISATEG